jgi:hypothetical protein
LQAEFSIISIDMQAEFSIISITPNFIKNSNPTCSREAVCELCEDLKVNVRCDGALAQHGLEDVAPAAVIWQRDVDQLVQAARAQQRWVNDVRPAVVCHSRQTATDGDSASETFERAAAWRSAVYGSK